VLCVNQLFIKVQISLVAICESRRDTTGVRGVWQPQAEALFDVCVVDTDAQSYAHRTVSAVLSTAEKEEEVHSCSRGTPCILPICSVS